MGEDDPPPGTCRKCGHVRAADAPEPPEQCPGCGAIYWKVEEALRRGEGRRACDRHDGAPPRSVRQLIGTTLFAVLGLIAVLLPPSRVKSMAQHDSGKSVLAAIASLGPGWANLLLAGIFFSGAVMIFRARRSGTKESHAAERRRAERTRSVFALLALAAIVGVLAGTFFLTGGDGDDYPADWPPVQRSTFAWLDSACPDLAGSYDDAENGLLELLGNPSGVAVNMPSSWEHLVRISPLEDGKGLRLDFRLNERGLAEYRNSVLQHRATSSQPTPGAPRMTSVELHEGRDYTCDGGRMLGRHWPRKGNSKWEVRKQLAVARDERGNLVIGATVERKQVFTLMPGKGIPLGTAEHTRWHRWPLRSRSSEVALEAEYGIDVRRYPLGERLGSGVPVRVTSFVPTPVCVAVRGPAGAVEADGEGSGASSGCRNDEALLDFGEGLRYPLNHSDRYQVRWRPVEEVDGIRACVVDVPDVSLLPALPRR